MQIFSPNATCHDVTYGDDANRNLTHISASTVGWAVSAVAALLAYAISIFLVFKHGQYYTKPNQQRYIIRIILMVPIYAIISWLSYFFYSDSIYYAMIRDSYEALVLASFFILLLQYLGDSPIQQRRILIAHEEKFKVVWPFCCIRYRASSVHFLQVMKYGIFQYVVIRPLCTVAAVITHSQHVYCPHDYYLNHAHVWIMCAQTLSVSIAMYAVVQFYVTIKTDIADHKPLAKFVSVKSIIFITFWQEIIIGFFVSADLIKPTDYWTADNVANGLSCFLSCLEMVIFAAFYLKAFDYRPYRPENRVRTPIHRAIIDSLNLLDMAKEVWYGCKYLRWMVFGGTRPGVSDSGRMTTMDIEKVMATRTREYELSIRSRHSVKHPEYRDSHLSSTSAYHSHISSPYSTQAQTYTPRSMQHTADTPWTPPPPPSNRQYLHLEQGLGSPEAKSTPRPGY